MIRSSLTDWRPMKKKCRHARHSNCIASRREKQRGPSWVRQPWFNRTLQVLNKKNIFPVQFSISSLYGYNNLELAPLTPQPQHLQFYLIRERSGQITWDNTILTDLAPISFVLGGEGGGGSSLDPTFSPPPPLQR